MLTLLLIGMLTLAFNIQSVKASGTIYIRADGSVEGTTHITSVDNVTYTFTDNIYDEIVVERDNIVVDGAGYTIQGTGSGKGIDLSGRSNVTIKNMEIKSFYYGIWLYMSSRNIISGNNITTNEYGIYLDESSNNTVSGNNANNNNYHGIFLYSSENNLISNNLVENSGYDGIFLNFADNNLISNNTCEYNGWHDIQKHGIELWNSDNNLISNNTCSSNYARGISLSHSDHNTISYNICENNYYHGIHLDYSSNNTISNNTCEHNSWGINLNYSSNNTISNNIANNNLGYDGICLWENCNNNTLFSNTCLNNTNGICLGGSDNNTLTNNTCENNAHNGIGLFDSSNYNSISRNNMANNGGGIWLNGSNYNSISGNNITANTWSGIGLPSSSNNTISGNNVTNSGSGIWLRKSSNNTLGNNDASNNEYNFGVSGSLLSHYIQDMDDSNTVNGKPVYYWVNRRDMAVPLDAGYVALVNCTNITVQSLNLTSNGQGVLLAFTTNSTITKNNITTNEYGIYLDESSNNKIYHNNFIDNTNQTFVQDVYTNIWDDGYPSGGNYWSDHVCTGNPSDGSQPYVIDTNNIDHYPFQDPNGWLLPPVITVLSPENKTYPVEDVPLTFTVSESTSWIGYSLDGQMNVTISGNTTIVGLSDGSHSLVVYAKDTAGNTGVSEIIHFSVSTLQPEAVPLWILGAATAVVIGIAVAVTFLWRRRK